MIRFHQKQLKILTSKRSLHQTEYLYFHSHKESNLGSESDIDYDVSDIKWDEGT